MYPIHEVKIKENEKIDKYLELARELNGLWNMKGMVIPIAIRALGMFTKGLVWGLEEFEIGGQTETIQNTALLGSSRILKRALKT